MRAFAISVLSVSRPWTSESGQSRHFDRGPATSDLPPGADIVPPGRHVSNLPKIELAGMAASGAKRPFSQITPAAGQLRVVVPAASPSEIIGEMLSRSIGGGGS